jgi:methylmalonyl-CoA mutase N-terminal domain/subunit
MHLFEVGEEVRQREVDRLNQVRARRDGRAVALSLAALRDAAQDESQNLMPTILAAVRAYCSVGEICGVLRAVFGEHQS